MGLLDRFRKGKEGETAGNAEKPAEEKEAVPSEESDEESKYGNETCSLCGAVGTEKKWMGQYWHKKCLRKMKKQAKGML